ncbi:MAG: host specificity factor TipJ family phage tail protein [Thermodesulfobacteriota bacterium]
MITAVLITNRLDPARSRIIRTFDPGRSLEAYFRELAPLADPNDFIFSVNGRVIRAHGCAPLQEEPGQGDPAGRGTSPLPLGEGQGEVVRPRGRSTWRLSTGSRRGLRDRDSLVIMPIPRGGDSGSKTVMATVAMLALVIAAPHIGAAAAGYILGAQAGAGMFGLGFSTAYTVLSGAISAGVIVAGGLLISAVFPRPRLAQTTPNSSAYGDTSPTYSWTTDANVTAEGSPVPIIYGIHRVVPPVIGKYVQTEGDKQFLNLLYALADHEVTTVTDIEINDNPISQYRDVWTEVRPGTTTQSVIQCFNDTRTDVGVGVQLSDTDWVTRTTQGNAAQGIGIGLSLPYGLTYINDAGGYDAQGLKVQIEYRLVGAGAWTKIQGAYLPDPTTITVDRWSAGYWDMYRGGGWIELEAGSTTSTDHTEGDQYETANPIFVWDPSDGDRGGYVPAVCFWRWVSEEQVYQPGVTLYDYIRVDGNTLDVMRRFIAPPSFPNAPGQYEVRVKLYEAAPAGARYRNDIYWEYLQEKILDDFRYPGTALLAVRALATDQLSGSLPRISCLLHRSTVPVWTGAAYEDKWANNPAWACYDLLHNSTYGGNIAAAKIDYSAFSDWADWCDAKGYYVNIYLDSAMSLRSALDAIATLGRGSVVQSGSKFTVIVDKPVDTGVQKFLFTMGNINKDSFREEWLALDQRANAVELTYYDAELDYSRQTVEIYADDFDTTTRSINKTSVNLIGCTSRTMAVKYGKALMNRNRYQTLTVSFEAAVDALACQPGDVVEVQHDVPQWGYGGRLVTATANTVTLDREVTRYPGVSYALTVQHADTDEREYVYITGVAVETTTDVLPQAGIPGNSWDYGTPVQFDLYSFGQVNAVYKQFQVLTITRSQELRRKITAIEVPAQLYADDVAIGDAENPSDLPAVAGLTASEVWQPGSDGAGWSTLSLAWRGYALGWYIFLKQAEKTQWTEIGWSKLPAFLVDLPLTYGQAYDVAVSPSRKPGDGESVRVSILGKLLPPSDVTGFTAMQRDDEIVLAWAHVADADLWGYQIRRGVTWEKAEIVIDGVQENRASWRPPLDGTYGFLIKAIDQSGLFSTTAASVSITVDIETELNIVLTQDEIPDEVGSGTLNEYMFYDDTPASEKLVWLPGMDYDDFPVATDFDAVSTKQFAGGDGVYTSQVYDLTLICSFTLRLDMTYTATLRDADFDSLSTRTFGLYPNDTFDSITSLDSAVLEYRVSDDNIVWSAWAVYSQPAFLSGRYWQMRVTTDIDLPNTYLAITALPEIIDVPDQEARALNQSIADTGTTFTLAGLGLNIVSEYHVGVTVLSAAARIPNVDKAASQFTVWVFDAAGAAVAATADIAVRGF